MSWTNPPTLKTTICPNCGYKLDGLPDEGTCPECGHGYDQSAVFLYGWPRGGSQNLALVKRSRIPLALIGAVGWIPYLLLSQKSPAMLFWFAVAMSPMILSTVWGLIHRGNDDRPGTIEVCLSANGLAQYNDRTDTPPALQLFSRWAWTLPLLVALGGVIAWQIELARLQTFVFTMVFCAIAFPSTLIAVRPHFRAAALLKSGQVSRYYRGLVPSQRWEDIETVRLKPLKSGNYHLQIELRRSAQRFLDRTRCVVDAEIICTIEQADELRALIEICCHGWTRSKTTS